MILIWHCLVSRALEKDRFATIHHHMVMLKTTSFEIAMTGIISKQVDTSIKLGDLTPVIAMEEFPKGCQQEYPNNILSGMTLLEMELPVEHAMLVKDFFALDLVDDLIDQDGQWGIATDINQHIGILTGREQSIFEDLDLAFWYDFQEGTDIKSLNLNLMVGLFTHIISLFGGQNGDVMASMGQPLRQISGNCLDPSLMGMI